MGANHLYYAVSNSERTTFDSIPFSFGPPSGPPPVQQGYGSGYNNGPGGYDNTPSGYNNGSGGYDNTPSGYNDAPGGYNNQYANYDPGECNVVPFKFLRGIGC